MRPFFRAIAVLTMAMSARVVAGIAWPLTILSAGAPMFTGFAGWVGWLFIHIAFLTGFRNRFGAVLTWAAAFARDARRERTFTTRQIERLHDVYDAPRGRDRPATGPGPSQP